MNCQRVACTIREIRRSIVSDLHRKLLRQAVGWTVFVMLVKPINSHSGHLHLEVRMDTAKAVRTTDKMLAGTCHSLAYRQG